MAKRDKDNGRWGLPKGRNPEDLVPDATRADHYIWPHPSGNPALDEVFHMATEFSDQRSEEEEDAAIANAARIRNRSAEQDAENIIAAAEARAASIIAEAEGQAKALKARGTMQPGPRSVDPADLDPDDPDFENPNEDAEERTTRGRRRPPPPNRSANVVEPTNDGGAVPGRDNPEVQESVA